MTDARLELGSVNVPEGWDVDVDAMIRARPKQPVPQLAGRPGTLKDPPAPTLLLQRRPASDDAAALLRMFLDKTAAATQGMRVADREPLVFADGARAVCALVSLDTTPPVTQIHAVRVDAGVMTHFVLATAAGDDLGMASLVATTATWRPPAQTADGWREASAADRDAAWAVFKAQTKAGWRTEGEAVGRDELHKR